MDSERIIMVLIALCGISIFFMVFSGAIKAVLRFLVRSIFGVIAIAVFKTFGIGLGLNPLCAGIVGALGLPGFLSLILLSVIL